MDLKDVNLQLTAYSYAYEMLYGKRPKSLGVVNFLKLKKPKMLWLEVKAGSIDTQEVLLSGQRGAEGHPLRVFFPRHSWWCDGCEYRELVPGLAMGHNRCR